MLGRAYLHEVFTAGIDDASTSRCLQQARHRWSEAATHTVAHAPHFSTALRQYTTSFTLAAKRNGYLPQHMEGRQVSRNFRVREDKVLGRLVQRLATPSWNNACPNAKRLSGSSSCEATSFRNLATSIAKKLLHARRPSAGTHASDRPTRKQR